MKAFFAIITVTICLLACKHRPSTLIAASRGVQVDTTAGSCPYLTKDHRNNLVLSWVKQQDSASFIYCYAVSQDEGATFGPVVEIPGSTNVHPHGENMPKIIFKPSGEIIAAWGAANPNPKNKYSGLVYYSQSFDEGKTWTTPRSLTPDTASFDQRYFDMALLPDGEAGIVWLDNRKPWKKEGSGMYYAVTREKEGFQNEKLISGPCCQCCRTDLYVDRNKNIHVLYRAILNDSIRDMVHMVSTDQGGSFSQPQKISEDNWAVSGCPHTGPAMAETPKGLHFTWFTGGKGAGIYYNHSADNGKTFTARDSVSGKTAKHCQIASLPNGKVLIVWNEGFVKDNTVNNRIGIEERDASGNTTAKDYVTPEGNNASFPVIYPVNEKKAVVAYTEKNGNKDQVLFKQVSLE
jgi:hypothetical protein